MKQKIDQDTHIPILVYLVVGKLLLYPLADLFQGHATLVEHGHCDDLRIVEGWLIRGI